MRDINPARIDKFLWAVRLFKTRSMAADACRMGRILIGGLEVKPSHNVSIGSNLTVRKPPVTFTYRIRQIPGNRVSAKLVTEYIEDLTPGEEKQKIEIQRHIPVAHRKKGTGRPTKKERRLIDRWREGAAES